MPKPTLRQSLDALSNQVGVATDKILASLNAARPPYEAAITDSRERVFVSYSLGSPHETINGRPGGVSFKTYDVGGQQVRYGMVNKNNYKEDGEFDGTNEVVSLPFAPPYTPNPPTLVTKEIYKRPVKFDGSYAPEDGPWSFDEGTDFLSPRSAFKAVWTFDDDQKSKIYAAGLAQFLLAPLKPAKGTGSDDWDQLFELTISAIITGGTGKYDGATGVTSTNSSAFVPAGQNFFTLPDDAYVPGFSVEIFRVILAKDWDEDEAKKRSQ